MKEIELAQVRAMLQEIAATMYGDRRASQSVMSIGSDSVRWSWLHNIEELANVIPALKLALHARREDRIALDDSIWDEFEAVYCQQVAGPLFADGGMLVG